MDTGLLDGYFGTEEMRAVFSDDNRVQKWLDVEAALARAQARLGIIPAAAAAEISRRADVRQMNLENILKTTEKTGGMLIVALIAELKRVCTGDAGEYSHWGATTQDILDSGHILQLKEAVAILVRDLLTLEHALIDLTRRHRTTLMAGRTHGQHAVPTTFGFKTAVWAREVHRHLVRFEQLRPRLMIGSMSAAVGTMASYGPMAHEMQRIALQDLGLGVPDISWHTARDNVAELVTLIAMASATNAKMMREMASLMRTEIGEVEEPFFEGKVGSSTMPQKRNPMMCDVVIGMEKLLRARVVTALEGMNHEGDRDMGPYVTELYQIPEVCVLASRGFNTCVAVMSNLVVKPERMRRNLELGQGFIMTENVMMKLAVSIGRQKAHEILYEASMKAAESGGSLREAFRANRELSSRLSSEEIERLMDPSDYVEAAARCADRVVALAEEGWARYGATLDSSRAILERVRSLQGRAGDGQGAVGRKGRVPLDQAQLIELKAGFRGQVIAPGDEAYDQARRVYNGMIDRRPAAIARCADVADVISAVKFGRAKGSEIAVRCGGHNAGGLGVWDDALVIDLSLMRNVRVDPAARIAHVGGGCTLGDVDHATHAFGQAVPVGINSTTGIGGLSLGGGLGYLTRAHGLSIDNMLSVDVVLADGSFVTASPSQNQDLFWAVRGGGGNFGVVTSFQFRTHPVHTVYAGPMFWPIDRAAEIMRLYRDTMAKADDDLNAFFAFLTVPNGDPFPLELRNKKMCSLLWTYTGPIDRAEKLFKPIRACGPPVLDWVGPMPMPALNSMFDPLYPPGLHWYWKADMYNDLTDEMIELHVEHGNKLPSNLSMMHLYRIDGAAARVGKQDTAWNYRDAKYSLVVVGVDTDPANNARNTAWARAYWSALNPFSAGGAYLNFAMGDEGQSLVKSSYGDNYARLLTIKRKYDPDNLFHINQNIAP